METAQGNYIFISYSRDDLSKVAPVVEEMRNSGYNVWYDADIQPGKHWMDNIASHIVNCTVFVPFLSQASRDSPYCQMEIHYAVALQKSVIPIYLEKVKLSEGVKMVLSPYQSIIYTESAEPAQLLEVLRKNLDFKRCVGNIPAPPSAPPPAPQKKLSVKTALKKVKQWIFTGWKFFFRKFFCPLGYVSLLIGFVFACFTVLDVYVSQNPLWFLNESGIMDIVKPPFLTLADYSYHTDSAFNPPPWAKRVESVQYAIIRKGVTRIGASSFQNCSNMELVLIPEGVISIGAEAFSGCAGLESVDIPQSVTDIGPDAFSGCTALKQVQFSGNIKTIGSRTFANCTALEEITIPNNVDYIGLGAFSGCSNLKTVHIQSDPERVEILDEGLLPPVDFGNLSNSDSRSKFLNIDATAFEPDTKIIFEPLTLDADVFEYIWNSNYTGGIFHEN